MVLLDIDFLVDRSFFLSAFDYVTLLTLDPIVSEERLAASPTETPL